MLSSLNFLKLSVIKKCIFFVGLALLLAQQSYALSNTPIYITFETTKGNIRIELYSDKAPNTVKNFQRYLREGYYNGTIFHRVISGFVIQGGGYGSSFEAKQTHNPINAEHTNINNSSYTIAMARTSEPNSATSQFFINLADNKFLDYIDTNNVGYTAFGVVVSGREVVDKIAKIPTKISHNMADVPTENVTIIKAYEE